MPHICLLRSEFFAFWWLTFIPAGSEVAGCLCSCWPTLSLQRLCPSQSYSLQRRSGWSSDDRTRRAAIDFAQLLEALSWSSLTVSGQPLEPAEQLLAVDVSWLTLQAWLQVAAESCSSGHPATRGIALSTRQSPCRTCGRLQLTSHQIPSSGRTHSGLTLFGDLVWMLGQEVLAALEVWTLQLCLFSLDFCQPSYLLMRSSSSYSLHEVPCWLRLTSEVRFHRTFADCPYLSVSLEYFLRCSAFPISLSTDFYDLNFPCDSAQCSSPAWKVPKCLHLPGFYWQGRESCRKG